LKVSNQQKTPPPPRTSHFSLKIGGLDKSRVVCNTKLMCSLEREKIRQAGCILSVCRVTGTKTVGRASDLLSILAGQRGR